MDLTKAIDDLDAYMDFVKDPSNQSAMTLDDLRPLLELDGSIMAALKWCGLQPPPPNPEGNLGYLRVPAHEWRHGFSIAISPSWALAMQSLRSALQARVNANPDEEEAIAEPPTGREFDVPMEDRITARSQRRIQEIATKEFGGKASLKSIQNWIKDGSLRTRQRGQLIEFSRSDLRELCGVGDDPAPEAATS